jgi:hypothetical protein
VGYCIRVLHRFQGVWDFENFIYYYDAYALTFNLLRGIIHYEMVHLLSPSRRGFSVRSILAFVLVVFITTILATLVSSQATHAVPGGDDAAWNGDSIIYDSHSFSLKQDFKDTTNTIPESSTVYQAPLRDGGPDSQKAFILYFSPGVDPPAATSANYVEFAVANNGDLSDAQNKKEISLTLKGEEEQLSSCSVDGVGWIICPLSVFIASGMDWIFGILANLIAVQPSKLGDTGDSMYIAWNVMRNIANIAFVIAFLVIIYSQLTNFGVSNYGLKKLIPRLIVAAVLVNVSFIITALAIDISNILGYSVQNVFNDIGKNVFNLTSDNFAELNDNPWTAITAIVLAGGGYIGATYLASSGTVILLVPLLLGLLITVMIVVIVLAARQAIITILVIIAPLAFVANLLPNTEKWFDKWKDLFFTMLIFFPAFSLVFGGSQLAGQLIIANATDNIVTVIFGLAVQIAPLVITPLILKLSGSLLGRIAQIANNPSKGVLDRSKNWANSKAEEKRQNTLGKTKINPLNVGGALMRKADHSGRNTKNRTELYKLRADNKYHDSDDYKRIHTDAAGAEMEKTTIGNNNERHIEALKRTPGSSLYNRGINAQASKEGLEAATNRTNQMYNERRVIGGTPLNISSNDLEASKATLETSENAKSVYQNRQRMMAGTVLNATVEPLEASKLRVEATQTQYANMVETMKVNPKSESYNVAQGLQASKEILEASQAQTQNLFDLRRRTAGTSLNSSTIQLENSKAAAEGSKSLTNAFITAEKANIGTNLHATMIGAERAKEKVQIADAQLSKVVENYKSGKIVDAEMTPALTSIMNEMQSDTIRLAAEKQAGTSAQFEIQDNIAKAMTGTGPMTEQLLDIAQGVGGDTARFRAQAQFVKNARSLETDALSANVELLKNKAQRSSTNVKKYSLGLLNAVLDGKPMYENESITPEIIKAAMQAQAEEKNIPLIERMKGDNRIDQDMLRDIVALNGGAIKGAGGFGLVDDPTLSIDNFDTKEEFDHALRVQRMSNLANANSSGLGLLKFGWVANSLANPEDLQKNIGAVLEEIEKGKATNATKEQKANASAAEASLKASFKTVRGALENPDTLADMRDREQFLRTIEAELADVFGLKPLEAENLEIKIDAGSYVKRDLPKESNVAPQLGDIVDGSDDTIPPPISE